MTKNINIYLVDDHSLFREGLSFLLSKLNFIDNIYEASSGEDFIEGLKEFQSSANHVKIDVVLIDIRMQGISGIEATKIALSMDQDIKIIALSMYSEESYYISMIDAGAVGFLLKNSNFNQVKKAMIDVCDGKNYFAEEVLQSIVKSISRREANNVHNYDISERESQILSYICSGLSNSSIADELSISKRTVDKHRENLLMKSNTKNTAQLVVFAIKNGYYKV